MKANYEPKPRFNEDENHYEEINQPDRIANLPQNEATPNQKFPYVNNIIP